MKRAVFTKGFTLIEIMVVLTIIIILSTIVYVSFGDSMNSAKSRAFVAEMKELQLAMELYKAQNGAYPAVPASCGSTTGTERRSFSGSNGSSGDECGDDYIEGLVPDYIAELPSFNDAPNRQCVIEYRTRNDESWYKFTAINCADPNVPVTQDNELARCPSTCPETGRCIPTGSGFQQTWAIYSLGGQCE